MKPVLPLILCITLGGCGLAARQTAGNEYLQSTANYKACLNANPAAPQNCESLRLAMQADEEKYHVVSTTVSGTQPVQADITVRNR